MTDKYNTKWFCDYHRDDKHLEVSHNNTGGKHGDIYVSLSTTEYIVLDHDTALALRDHLNTLLEEGDE